MELEQHSDLKTQADAVLYFLQHLDIDMVNSVLEENRTYQDFEKPIFIHKLGNALAEFLEAGDTFLNSYSGFCNSVTCNFKSKGFTFIGNNSDNYFDLIIDIREGIVYDIYECSIFKCLTSGINKNTRIEIDKSEFPF